MSQLLVWERGKKSIGPTPLVGYSGKVRLFTITWGATRSDKGDYELSSKLGTVLYDRGTEEVLKDRAEKLFANWLNEAGLMKKDLEG